jgi:hypothetical protein
MTRFVTISLVLAGLVPALDAESASERARELELKGDALAARQLLHQSARNAPQDAAAVLAYAEFLDRHRDPETRTNYEKALALETDRAVKARIARRLALIALDDGDRNAAAKYIADYRAARGEG